MKATGIVRRIFNFGRIVIPKGIRRTLKIGRRHAVDNIDSIRPVLMGNGAIG